MPNTWLLADSAAQSTAPGAITNSQATLVLASTANFPVPGAGQQYYIRIDTTPITTVYEYALVTANNTGTNTLTLTRGQAGTSGQGFSAGATVTYAFLAETLIAAFVRLDQTSQQNLAGALAVPPSGGGTIPPTNYGTLPVKLAEFSGAAASYTFSSIPQTFRSIELVAIFTSDQAAPGQIVFWQANGDASANYDFVLILAGTSSALAKFSALAVGSSEFAHAPASASSPRPGHVVARWTDYAGATFWKECQSTASSDNATEIAQRRYCGQWRSTQAITSLRVFPQTGGFAAGSWAELWGYP